MFGQKYELGFALIGDEQETLKACSDKSIIWALVRPSPVSKLRHGTTLRQIRSSTIWALVRISPVLNGAVPVIGDKFTFWSHIF